ncbi:N-formylglutamate amidohydrolase [Sphingomonas zeicaulis]|uniref:N-formylglutamate amidohydrolase n=1 Tax=Sphingomonas zeicaulis TaxID=1632740 RepID=UPI003D1E97B4
MAQEDMRPAALIGPDDPPPFTIINPEGRASFLLIGDHAGDAVPARLDGLGVSPAERDRHIGRDIGTARLGMLLAAALDAPFVAQTYSRLVIDCNRDPNAADAMPAVSDGTVIPGNAALSAADRADRIVAIHAPYHAAIATLIAHRRANGSAVVLVSLHSFTPVMGGIARPWHAGVLHDAGDTRFARAMLAALDSEPDLIVGDNQPYRMDATDHSVPRHAYPAQLPYLELEIRQDLLASGQDIAGWAARLARLLPAALPFAATLPI